MKIGGEIFLPHGRVAGGYGRVMGHDRGNAWYLRIRILEVWCIRNRGGGLGGKPWQGPVRGAPGKKKNKPGKGLSHPQYGSPIAGRCVFTLKCKREGSRFPDTECEILWALFAEILVPDRSVSRNPS